MRLHVCVLHSEKLLCTLDCEFFCNVYAVISLSGITFRILVGVKSTCRRKHRVGNDVFACDKFEIVLLTFKLLEHGRVKFGIDLFYAFEIYHLLFSL